MTSSYIVNAVVPCNTTTLESAFAVLALSVQCAWCLCSVAVFSLAASTPQQVGLKFTVNG